MGKSAMSEIEAGGVVVGGGLFSPDQHETLFKRLMDDPLLAPTEKRRNHLMITACFAILTSAYGVKVTKTPVPHEGLLRVGVADPSPSLQSQHSCCLGS